MSDITITVEENPVEINVVDAQNINVSIVDDPTVNISVGVTSPVDIGELTGGGYINGNVPVYNGNKFIPGIGGYTDIGEMGGSGFAANQVPVWDGDNFVPTSGYQRKYTRTLIVDPGGKGDYTTIKAACDYVATQTHDTNNRWVIIVYGRIYSEPFSVPSYTTIQGPASVPSLEGPTIIDFSRNAGGNMIVVDNSVSLTGLLFFYIPTAQGTIQTSDVYIIKPVSAAYLSATISNCFFNVQNSTARNHCALGPYETGGGPFVVSVYYSVFQMVNSGTGTASVVNDTGASVALLMHWSDIFMSETFAVNVSGSRLVGCRVTASVSISTSTTIPCPGTALIGPVIGTGKFTFPDHTIRNSEQSTWIASTSTLVPGIFKGATSQSANLIEAQNSSAAIQWGIGSTGQIKTNQITTATSLGVVVGKMPIYDAGGTLKGYYPIYNNIT